MESYQQLAQSINIYGKAALTGAALFGIIYKICTSIHKHISKPKLTWGIYDIPPAEKKYCTVYYIEASNKMPLPIKLVLRPYFKPSDYSIVVRHLATDWKAQHMQQLSQTRTNFEDRIEVTFQAPVDTPLRVTIESRCDNGYTPDIDFEAPEARVTRDDRL